MDLKQALQVIDRTGKYIVGYRETVKELYRKKPVLVIASKQAETNMLKTVKMVANSVGVPLLLTDLSPAELGITLRKPFSTSFIAVLDPGASDILEQTRSEKIE